MSVAPSPRLPLGDLGWDQSWIRPATRRRPRRALRPARVTLQGRDAWRVHDGVGELTARRARPAARRSRKRCPSPATGCCSRGTSPDDSVIEAGAAAAQRARAQGGRRANRGAGGRRQRRRRPGLRRGALGEPAQARARAHDRLGVRCAAGRRRDEVRPRAGPRRRPAEDALAEVRRGRPWASGSCAVSSYDGDGLDAVRAMARAASRSRSSGRRARGSRRWSTRSWARRCSRRRRSAPTTAGSIRRRRGTSCPCPAAGSCSTPRACASSRCGPTRTRWMPRSATSTTSPASAGSPTARTGPSRAAPCSPPWRPGCSTTARLAELAQAAARAGLPRAQAGRAARSRRSAADGCGSPGGSRARIRP